MRHRQVIAAALSAGMLGLFPGVAAGAPSSRDVRTSALCQSLRETARPALTGLMKNDGLLEEAQRALTTSDRLALRTVTGDLAANLSEVSEFLGHGFPQDANATAASQEQLMKVRLEAVASAQNDALNVIEGFTQTQDIGRARNDFPGGREENEAELLPFDTEHRTGAGVASPTDPATPLTGLNQEQLADPAAPFQMTRSRIGQLEDKAGVAVMAVAQLCNSR
ncbi:MAG TPA: hypothetical protein VNG31_09945 [Candidatus Baltobacteraceae bacterium]|nr:hypothetical protein [Candidatus Baltobacteraceae bacterium]